MCTSDPIPESMQAELKRWNNGDGIDLETWVGCEGSFSLAVGYATIFWPKFVKFEGYILREGFSETNLRGFEKQCKGDKRYVEDVMNHIHIADIQHLGCKDLTKDKLELLGKVFKEIYEAKLSTEFPANPCTVEFHVPQDKDDFMEYQVSFWQVEHERDFT